jgi:hypothetical protein
MQGATRAALQVARRREEQRRDAQVWVVPEQGAPAPARAVLQANLRYWQALSAAITLALEQGADPLRVPAHLPGMPPGDALDPHHALNWQRAWRQAEALIR